MEDVWGEDGARGGVSYKKNKRRLAVRLGKRNRQGFMGEEDCIKGIQMLSPEWPKIPCVQSEAPRPRGPAALPMRGALPRPAPAARPIRGALPRPAPAALLLGPGLLASMLLGAEGRGPDCPTLSPRPGCGSDPPSFEGVPQDALRLP